MIALGSDQAGYELKQEIIKYLEENGYGIGISIAANKVKGIRAAVCGDCFSAEATRLHNDANIVALGARVTGPGLAVRIVDTFLHTEFSSVDRHIRRVEMIEE